MNDATFKNDDFVGYTYLIGGLEKAFTHLYSKRLILSTPDSLLGEVLLNTQNFLIVTNGLLNLDGDDIITVLGPYLKMFLKFLNAYSENTELLLRVRTALQETMNRVLLLYGVVYKWVYPKNRWGHLWGGIVLMLAFVFAGSMIFILVVVLVSGNLIGGGGYYWYREHCYLQMQRQIIQEYQLGHL